MSPTILFTHLKFILLQYFQFSIFNKINYIQTYPYIEVSLHLLFPLAFSLIEIYSTLMIMSSHESHPIYTPED